MTARPNHLTASHPAHPEHEDTEKRLRRMCDGHDPEFWLAEGTWIDFRKYYAAGYWAWLYLLYEKRLRMIARKYRGKPTLFLAAKDRFLEPRATKLGLPYHREKPPSLVPPNKYSSHQLAGLQKLLPLMEYQRNSLTTEGLTALAESIGITPKQILKIIRSLISNRAGRKPEDKYDKALLLFQSHRSLHQICMQLDPDYRTAQSRDLQRRSRERMKSGIFRRLRHITRNSNGT
jgi:hypothetical protein